MFNIDRLMEVLSEILSDMYNAQIIMSAVPKDEAA